MHYTVLGIDRVLARTKFVRSDLSQDEARELVMKESDCGWSTAETVIKNASHTGFGAMDAVGDKDLYLEVLSYPSKASR